jgi:hypothetical protein
MDDRDKMDFGLALAKVALIHRVHMDRPSIKVYFEALQDLPLPDIQQAFTRLIAHAGDFMPKPGHVRDEIDKIREEAMAQGPPEVYQSPRLRIAGAVDPAAPIPAEHWFECNICEDAGWRETCAGGCPNPRECPKREAGGYCIENDKAEPAVLNSRVRLRVRACECRETNKTYRRGQQSSVKAPKAAKRYSGPRHYWEDTD